MAIVEDPNWVSNTKNDSRWRGGDIGWLSALDFATMKAATLAVANYILTNVIDADAFLQEFVNRATTDIGYNLEIMKGLHQAADSNMYFPTRHFDAKAVSAKGTGPANFGTNGIIYHLYVATGTNVPKKGGTIILDQIDYKEGGVVKKKQLGSGIAVKVV